jgi:hypothetical protein
MRIDDDTPGLASALDDLQARHARLQHLVHVRDRGFLGDRVCRQGRDDVAERASLLVAGGGRHHLGQTRRRPCDRDVRAHLTRGGDGDFLVRRRIADAHDANRLLPGRDAGDHVLTGRLRDGAEPGADHDHLGGCDGRSAVCFGDLAAYGARTLCGERARQGDTPRQQQGGDPT